MSFTPISSYCMTVSQFMEFIHYCSFGLHRERSTFSAVGLDYSYCMTVSQFMEFIVALGFTVRDRRSQR